MDLTAGIPAEAYDGHSMVIKCTYVETQMVFAFHSHTLAVQDGEGSLLLEIAKGVHSSGILALQLD